MLEISQNSNTKSVKSAFTKQGIQLVHWFMTWNNYNEENIIELETKMKKFCKKFIFQEEIGKEGTKHLQGNFQLLKKMRWSEFGLPKTIHWEKTRNVKASNTYCQKDDTHTGRRWSYGFPIENKIINNLYPWQKSIEDIIVQDPDDRSIYWIYDPAGDNGKTQLCKYLITKYDIMVATSGSEKDIACMIALAKKSGRDLNAKNTCFVFHFARCTGKISYHGIEAVKDGLITSSKYESSTLCFNSPHVFVFSNIYPDTSTMTQDRWKIKTINGLKEMVDYESNDIENNPLDDIN